MSAGAKGEVVCNLPQGPPPLSRLVGNGLAKARTPGFEHRAGHARGKFIKLKFAPARVLPPMRAVRLRSKQEKPKRTNKKKVVENITLKFNDELIKQRIVRAKYLHKINYQNKKDKIHNEKFRPFVKQIIG